MKIFAILILGIIALSGCQQENAESIPFEVASRYFVKNSADSELLNLHKIDNQETFEQLYGPAATMGPNGIPTNIDFQKQFVISVILPPTEIETEVRPGTLEQSPDGNLLFTYQVQKGDSMSFTIVPNLLVVVDKIHEGPVEVKELTVL